MRPWLILASLLLGACLGRQLLAVSLPPVRHEQQGFSFLPLDEPGWVVLTQEPDQIILGGHSASADGTFAIQGALVPIPDGRSFDEIVADLLRQPSPDPSGRFGSASSNAEPAPEIGAKCMRNHAVAKDFRAVKRSANPDPLVLEVWAIYCPALDDPSRVVVFGYSTRYAASERDPESDAKAAEILDSFELTRVQPGGG